MSKIFSVPLNPMISEKYFFETFYPFLERNKDLIYDIYFTCRIPPFDQDAMGTFLRKEDWENATNNAMMIQQTTGIKVSATFNNINVSPKHENYRIFIDSFKSVYEKGVRSMTLAHAHWVALGIKNYFPEMEIKNTILRKVATSQDFVYAAEQGFDYINVDRILMRDVEELKNIKRAQHYIMNKYNRYVKTALLTNEGCLGRCPVMDEHYSYNNLKKDNELPYFRHEISKVTCEYKWENEINAFFFKAATIPPFKDEYDFYLDHVDVLKMHGRDNIDKLNDTITIIDNYRLQNQILNDSSQIYLDGVPSDELLGWRNKIKKCRFQCWDCNYCDIVSEHKKKKYNV